MNTSTQASPAALLKKAGYDFLRKISGTADWNKPQAIPSPAALARASTQQAPTLGAHPFGGGVADSPTPSVFGASLNTNPFQHSTQQAPTLGAHPFGGGVADSPTPSVFGASLNTNPFQRSTELTGVGNGGSSMGLGGYGSTPPPLSAPPVTDAPGTGGTPSIFTAKNPTVPAAPLPNTPQASPAALARASTQQAPAAQPNVGGFAGTGTWNSQPRFEAPAPSPAAPVALNQPSPAQASPAAQAQASTQQAPTAQQLQQFRHSTGSNFDPHSAMDMANMRRMMQGGAGATMNHSQWRHGMR